MRKVLNVNSDRYKRIMKAEEVLAELGIKICSQSELYLTIDNIEYNIGRDSDEFPRYVEEPFWREL